MNIQRHESLPSTMDEARRLAQAGAEDGTVVVAATQTQGRGRQGSWKSPPGGLYLSAIFRGIADARLLTLAVGNAVADVLEVAGAEPRVKWVNDVFIDDAKVAGILVESESKGENLDFVVAGIGINANGAPKEYATDQPVTTLEACLGADNCIPDLETFLLESLRRWVDVVRAGDHGRILTAYRARDLLAGRRVRVTGAGAEVEGLARGIDDQGRLLVEAGGTTRPFDHGTVRLGDV